ncbi:hypothetical protein QE368_001776 [Asaia bogorensis NBRC 16594]|nr:hypothetical protein [Asaia bogorensis NBRC 16594]
MTGSGTEKRGEGLIVVCSRPFDGQLIEVRLGAAMKYSSLLVRLRMKAAALPLLRTIGMEARPEMKTIAGMHRPATRDHEHAYISPPTPLNLSMNAEMRWNTSLFLVRYFGLSGLILGRIEFNSVPFSLAYSRLIDVAM